MEESDFRIEFAMRSDAATLYRAVATQEGIQGWWTLFTEFDGKQGSVAEMRFPKTGFFTRMQVEQLAPYQIFYAQAGGTIGAVPTGALEMRGGKASAGRIQ
ncbi:hypothetical protein [Nitrospina watsonii]|uniref:SRPBCC domain-containing protein n=1 Tax=Nitrospina watsonii TaxID=1323948 RepID=A0ABM9HF53_9BACT|nr:hypothetical protein [Nitrospina watsonii]CAI2718665.1 protein of unknown function [Nitrospina watsonii]